MTAFCDWLDVTYHPESSPVSSLRMLLVSLGAEVMSDEAYRLGDGTVHMARRYGVLRVSASGGALAHMRLVGAYMDWLSLLSEHPHRITRLDAAHDVDRDGADVLDELRQANPSGQVNLGRKALPVSLLLAVRSDGRETGSYYVGRRSRARATARVYDKRQERLDKRGQDGPPRTRYEVTVKQDYGATLRDAAEPERLFWHVAAPALLDKPDDAPDWSPDWSQGWRADPRPELLPAEVLERRLSNSAELSLLRDIADEMGPQGRVWLLRQLAGVLGVSVHGSLSRAPTGLSEPHDAV